MNQERVLLRADVSPVVFMPPLVLIIAGLAIAFMTEPDPAAVFGSARALPGVLLMVCGVLWGVMRLVVTKTNVLEASHSSIRIKSGVLSVSDKVIPLKDVETEVRYGLLGRLLHYGSVVIRSGSGKESKMRFVNAASTFARDLERVRTGVFFPSYYDKPQDQQSVLSEMLSVVFRIPPAFDTKEYAKRSVKGEVREVWEQLVSSLGIKSGVISLPFYWKSKISKGEELKSGDWFSVLTSQGGVREGEVRILDHEGQILCLWMGNNQEGRGYKFTVQSGKLVGESEICLEMTHRWSWVRHLIHSPFYLFDKGELAHSTLDKTVRAMPEG